MYTVSAKVISIGVIISIQFFLDKGSFLVLN